MYSSACDSRLERWACGRPVETNGAFTRKKLCPKLHQLQHSRCKTEESIGLKEGNKIEVFVLQSEAS